MALERIQTNDLAEWISDGTDCLLTLDDPNWRGNFVSHCIPPIFQAYCKLFHPIYTDDSVPADSGSWAAADDEPEMPGRLVSVSTDSGPHGRRVRWQELADKFGLRFHSEFNDTSLQWVFPDNSWPRSLLGPDEGSLDAPTCRRLIEVLKPFTGDATCFFHYDLIATRGCEAEVGFRGKLEDATLCCDNDVYGSSPTHWWPDNREWLVCTDWDLKFTLVGGSSELIARLLADDELECIAVTSQTRIDFRSDRLNLQNSI
ncbi:MAG: hypothetical protein K1Y36_28320 [Blastocatellia bacterium]|nr:hypothetical protein [Blastocatellia bacterium]